MRPLGEYDWPSAPTDETLRRLWKRFMARVRKSEPGPFVAEEDLRTTSSNLLDDVAAPPHCEPYLTQLQAELAPWAADPQAVTRTRLIVVPPCEDGSVVETWARRNGFEVLEPPTRPHLLEGAGDDVQVDAPHDAPVLVVPRLEAWFLRHRNGLHAVRRLLFAIDRTDRRVVVGCNSWAWAFLAKAVEADMVLNSARTFQAFHADDLRDWLGRLAHGGANGGREPVTVRSAESGKALFGEALFGEDGRDREGNGKGEGEGGGGGDDTFKRLAARSLGIPWVAWHLWRRSLRASREEAGEDGAHGRAEPGLVDTRRTVWVTRQEPFDLPDGHERTALLVLHALLLHGGLTARELATVLPEEGATPIVAALVSRGFVQRSGSGDETRLRCRGAAYPSVRAELAELGFPLDTL